MHFKILKTATCALGLMLMSSVAFAKTVTVEEVRSTLPTRLEITSVNVELSCATDRPSGDGDYRLVSSKPQKIKIYRAEHGYQVVIPSMSVSYNTFFRKQMGCSVTMTGFEGFDPDSGLPLDDSSYNFVEVGGSAKSDGREVALSITEILQKFGLCALAPEVGDTSVRVERCSSEE